MVGIRPQNITAFSYALLMFFIVVSCGFTKTESQQEISDRQYFYKGVEDNSLKLSSIFREYEIVKLETSSDSFLPLKYPVVKSSDQLIVIFDDKTFFAFDRDTGKFKFKIDAFGKGPGEYITPIDFYLDIHSERIEILDKLLRKILIFDFKGKFVEEFSIPVYARNIHRINNEEYIFYLNNQDVDGVENNVAYWNKNSNQLVYYSPINKTVEGLYLSDIQTFVESNNKYYLRENFSNKIIKYSDSTRKNIIFELDDLNWFDFGKLSKKEFKSKLEKLSYIIDDGGIFNIDSFFPFEEGFITMTTCFEERFTYYLAGSWEDKYFRTYKSIENDLDGLNTRPLTNVFFSNNEALSFISGNRCLKLYSNAINSKLDVKMKNALQDIDISDNGIVIVYQNPVLKLD